MVRRKAVVFLISDFLAEADDLSTPLRLVNRRHDLVVFHITDPRERALPDVGFLALEDAESGAAAWIDTSSKAVRTRYEQQAEARTAELATRLRRLNVDLVEVSTDEGWVAP